MATLDPYDCRLPAVCHDCGLLQNGNTGFLLACGNGHLTVAEWLVDHASCAWLVVNAVRCIVNCILPLPKSKRCNYR